MSVLPAEIHAALDDLPIVAFVGSPISFSNELVRLVASDLPDFRVKRFTTLTELARAEALAAARVVTLVLEEGYADRLVEDYDRVQAVVPHAHLALAYRNPDLAVRLLRALSRGPQLARLCLLPMRMQYDTWRSIVSLLISGEGYLPHDVVDAVLRPAPPADAEQPGPRRPPVPMEAAAILTERELQVLDLVSKGKQNKSVAAELGLSEHTVKLHMHHIITKLRARNRTEATIWYLSRSGAAAPPPLATVGGHLDRAVRPN